MAQPQLGRFGNRHLATTGDDLLAAMQKQRTMWLHALASDRNETRRFNDFLDNEAVTRHEMLVYAGQLTARRAVGRHVLVIADTSEANFATHTGRKRGFGTVGKRQGYWRVRPPAACHGRGTWRDPRTGWRRGHHPPGRRRACPREGGDGTPQAAEGGRQGVPPLAGRRGDRGRRAGRGCDDHRGRGPRGRHLRPVRPSLPLRRRGAGQRAPDRAGGAGPFGWARAETVRRLRRLAGGRPLSDQGSGEARKIWQRPACRAHRPGRRALRRGDLQAVSLRRQGPAGEPDNARGGCAGSRSAGGSEAARPLVPADHTHSECARRAKADPRVKPEGCLVPDALDHRTGVPHDENRRRECRNIADHHSRQSAQAGDGGADRGDPRGAVGDRPRWQHGTEAD